MTGPMHRPPSSRAQAGRPSGKGLRGRAWIFVMIGGIVVSVAAAAAYLYWPEQVSPRPQDPCKAVGTERLDEWFPKTEIGDLSESEAPFDRSCSLSSFRPGHPSLSGAITVYRSDEPDQRDWAVDWLDRRCKAQSSEEPVGDDDNVIDLQDVDVGERACSTTTQENRASDEETLAVDIYALQGMDVIGVTYREQPGDQTRTPRAARDFAKVVVKAYDH